MPKKYAICESCEQQKVLHEITKHDYSTDILVETKYWWCLNCYEIEWNKSKISKWKK